MLKIINILFLLNTGRFQNRFQNVFHPQFLQIILSLTVGRADYSAYRQALLKFPVAITEVRQGVDRHLAEATARIRRDPWASKHLTKRESQSPHLCCLLYPRPSHSAAAASVYRLQTPLHSPYSTARAGCRPNSGLHPGQTMRATAGAASGCVQRKSGLRRNEWSASQDMAVPSPQSPLDS